ncbi:hypothetical protein LTR67_008418 [Exophiala xenobiotica]
MTKLIGEWQSGKTSLADTGKEVRNLFLRGDWPDDAAAAINTAYQEFSAKAGTKNLGVAVRSSATAEDLPHASFAGQQETFLNISGEDALLNACRRCYASLFTDRAISYRQTKHFDHMKVALSIGVQQMVRSHLSGSGVMSSIDTESCFDKVVLISAAWGLDENIVKALSTRMSIKFTSLFLSIPSTFRSLKRSALASWACTIEQHYGCPMDIEWAKDGVSGDLFIVQTRPETVQARREAGVFKTYKLGKKGSVLTTRLSVGEAAVTGRLCLLETAKDIDKFVGGSILVTETTEPDRVPIMKRAAAIITDHGGRTSHAAIVSRELGVPAVVGTGNATYLLHTGKDVTVSCAEGDEGFVYDGIADITTKGTGCDWSPPTRTKIMLSLANPASAYRWWRLPADGIGLARMEFVVSNHIQVHPMALVRFDHLKDEKAKQEIARLTKGYADFVGKLARGLACLCAAVYPKPAIVRLSDFKTNEYANLVGGEEFEPKEENPMLGFRGASRYYSPRYKEGFALECRAIKRLREGMGFTNAIVMVPFCRTVGEAAKVLRVMSEDGLTRGENGLQVYVMCEIPSNVILAAEFTALRWLSIGSNHLTQLTLGLDREVGELANLFDEQDKAAKWMILTVIAEARKAGRKIGLCGQAPSNHPEFAAFLVECGINSVSVSPDSFLEVKKHVIASEKAETNGSA